MSRKHITQMRGDEKAFIHGYLRTQVGRLSSGVQHFYDRATERHFSLEDAISAVRCGLVVEVHDDKKPSVRALVRDQKGTCVVVELGSLRIITVYYNDPADQHDTLNWNLYRWTVDVVELVKSFRRAA